MLLETYFIMLTSYWYRERFTDVYVAAISYVNNCDEIKCDIFRKIFDIKHSKPQNLNDSRLVLRLSVSNPLKPGVKSRLKMQLEQDR